jgi:UDP-glucose 4-epimerase
VALRYFNVYGPRQRPDSEYAAAVPLFLSARLSGRPVVIYGDGGQTRDLVYVADVVRANLLAAERPGAPGRVFNICSGREIRVLDLIAEIDRQIPGAPAPVFTAPRPGDIYRSVGDPRLVADALGFQPAVPLERGLAETIAWMKF